jgi:glutamate 5-kinase
MEYTKDWNNIKQYQRIVVKVGTSTLSYPNGRLNFRRIEQLTSVLTDLQKSGKKVTLVSSGAIGVGSGRLGITTKPTHLDEKQALAAVGQAELMKIYQKFFESQDQKIAQVLLTKDIVDVTERRLNAMNTLNALFEMDVIPIINENDTIATDEIEFGDNDTLSAYVAVLAKANLLVLLTDIDGLYTSDPRENENASIIPTISEITTEIEKSVQGTSNGFGTGGMITKIAAARICMDQDISVVISNGANPCILKNIVEGKPTGTLFHNKDRSTLKV